MTAIHLEVKITGEENTIDLWDVRSFSFSDYTPNLLFVYFKSGGMIMIRDCTILSGFLSNIGFDHNKNYVFQTFGYTGEN